MQTLHHWRLVYHASLDFPLTRERAPCPKLILFSWGNNQLILTFTGKISKESSGPFRFGQGENLLEQGHLFSSSALRPVLSLSTRCSLCRTAVVNNAMKPDGPVSKMTKYIYISDTISLCNRCSLFPNYDTLVSSLEKKISNWHTPKSDQDYRFIYDLKT